MFIRLLLVSIFLFYSQFIDSKPHQHGVGQAFIAQEDSQWLVNLVLPASDVLGFEHHPKSKEEILAFNAFKAQITEPGSLVKLNGNCKSANSKLVSPSVSDHHSQGHHHDHSESHHHDSSSSHLDLEIEFSFFCESDVTQVDFPVLAIYEHLDSIEVSWIINEGQGAKTLSSSFQKLTF